MKTIGYNDIEVGDILKLDNITFIVRGIDFTFIHKHPYLKVTVMKTMTDPMTYTWKTVFINKNYPSDEIRNKRFKLIGKV